METIIFPAVLLAVVALFFLNGIRQERQKQNRMKQSLKEGYGKQPDKLWTAQQYEEIRRYHEKHKEKFEIDDMTWNDLGMDEIFRRVDYTLSQTGAEYLYHTLRSPQKPKQLAEREAKIAYYRLKQEERLTLQLEFARLGSIENYSLYDCLERLEELEDRSLLQHYICPLAVLAAVAAMCVVPGIGVAALLVVLLYNIFSYLQEKGRIAPYLSCFTYILRMLQATGELERKKLPGIQEETEELKRLHGELRGVWKGAWMVMGMGGSTNPFGLLWDYVRMIFHFDLIRFHGMKKAVWQHREEIERMLSVWGELELIVNIGMYRASVEQEENAEKSCKGWCMPDFIDEGSADCFVMENGYYPLLPHAVKNSLKTGRGILLTGSNASGKSTFLKTCAVNILLAQTFHTCLADKMVLRPGRLYSSMALKDNLLSGESYYMVEIKALKRVMDARLKEKGMLYCFVDEVLRGTNTVERIAASTELLKTFVGEDILCFAATHDVELTSLLEKDYDNYHFEEALGESDVQFSYELKKGRTVTRNAIRLLKSMGYESGMVERAEKRAEAFLRTGSWKEVQ
ncbi:MAG: hypothetical protein J6B10_07030 [Lachnospiraceae bacterium]|nr:hypothetical protein [Lachnospiraceae bacterium]